MSLHSLHPLSRFRPSAIVCPVYSCLCVCVSQPPPPLLLPPPPAPSTTGRCPEPLVLVARASSFSWFTDHPLLFPFLSLSLSLTSLEQKSLFHLEKCLSFSLSLSPSDWCQRFVCECAFDEPVIKTKPHSPIS